MKTLYPNLDFEYELATGSRRLNSVLLKHIERWRAVMRLLPGWEEASVEAEGADEVLPWGYSESARAFAKADSWPNPETVSLVNSKLYSHQLEQELGMQLPGACVAGSLEEVRAAAARCPSLLVKAPFGVSGRERVEIRDGVWDERVEGWLASQLKTTRLICEPRVAITRDLSFQFEISDSGEVEFLGWSTLLTDQRGQHRGHMRETELPPACFQEASAAVESVATEGYWGPVGVDSFMGELDGEAVVRPLCEINARMTFGRLALELFKTLEWNGVMYWWHPSARLRKSLDVHEPVQPDSASGLYLLPERVDPGGGSGSVVGLALDSDSLPWA